MTGTERGSEPVTGADENQGTLLIVDDQPENIRVLYQLLHREGYRVLVARDGRSALERVAYAAPELVLLDVLMPELDGFEVCRRLKADPAHRHLPVLFMTALSETRDKVEGLNLGASDYITKPFQAEEVLARVRTHLQIARLQRALEARNAELKAFAHTVAHDLKNPLGVITGAAELAALQVARAGGDERVARNLQRICDAGHGMAETIDALLLLAEVSHRGEIALTPLDSGRLVAELLEGPLAQRLEAIGARVALPPAWPAAVGYTPWVRQIWLNYLENALKYGGSPPQIALLAEARGAAVRFSVCDNGPGLTPDEQAALFTPFTRVHRGRVPGHGLGLTIVRQIAEKLGGAAGVEGSPGNGSAFWFTLPADGTAR